MALYTCTTSTDFAGKPKRLASWHVGASSAAVVVNFRNGGASGAIQFTVNLSAAAQSASQAYSFPNLPTFPSSLYIDISGGTAQICVDLV